jgi:NAD(P)H-flavin reductase
MITSRIIELWNTSGNELGGKVTMPADLHPAPGQYLLARREGAMDPLPVPLFPAGLARSAMTVVPPLPDSWRVGDTLTLRGPFGKGFHLPRPARRVLLADFGTRPQYLAPLIERALAQNADLALFALQPPPGLPAAVELIPPEALPDSASWADYLAISLPLAQATDVRRLLRLPPGRLLPAGQVLVETDMPCGSSGECGVCALHTRRGWKLCCRDGPVFDLHLIEVV